MNERHEAIEVKSNRRTLISKLIHWFGGSNGNREPMNLGTPTTRSANPANDPNWPLQDFRYQMMARMW